MKLNDTYTLVEEIGSGGGGIVYKAYHENLRTYVVVKQIKERVKGILESRAEADILKNIKHTYLPRVYDFLEIDGEIYTVMDYIPGKSMDKALKEAGCFPAKMVLKWANQLAEALYYLHSQMPPVIHSDIKPANVMLTPEGDICLIDFNISLAFDSGMKTSTGISGGYSPPEQYRDFSSYRQYTGTQKIPLETETMTGAAETVLMTGTSGADGLTTTQSMVEHAVGRGVDARSDIYSLGATLYHFLTGEKPSTDFEQILPIDQYEMEIGEGFAHILKKMMELLPEDRYQNGGELVYALRNIYDLDGEYQKYRQQRHGGKMAAVLLFVAGGILTGSGWMVLQNEKNVSYNRSVEYAQECIAAGNMEEASEFLTEAIHLRPKQIEAYRGEVLRLYQMGDYENCIRYAVDILQNPVYEVKDEEDQRVLADIYYILGNSYLEQEKYADAAGCLEEAILQSSDNRLYYRDYAVAQAKLGQISEAESALETAEALHLGQDSIYMVQGEIAFVKGEYEKAEEQLLKAVSSTQEESLRRRAVLLCDRVYRTLGKDFLDQEIALLEQEENQSGAAASAMNLSERLADAYARKAEADEEHRQEYYGKAIDRFTFLYENGYSTRQMMENIAILYEQMNEYDRAEALLLEMVEKYPDRYEGYKRLAYLEADIQQTKENTQRDYQKMKAYYDKAQELYGDRADDLEMQMLETWIEDLKAGNWF